MLEAKSIYYQASGKTLIDNVSLQLNTGEMVAIIGPNGAGKSTLLRLLTGYLSCHKGQCTLFDKPLIEWSVEELAKSRAVMRQHSNINFAFTVREIISMGRACYGKYHQQEAIEHVLKLTDCHMLEHRYYNQLSGGEQQRVQLARVLVQLWQPHKVKQSRWLFLDEPTSALDLYHQQHTLRLLKQLTENEPLSVCCVLHDLNLAALYADRIILLHQGKIVAEGSPKHVLQPDTLQHWYKADLGVSYNQQTETPQVYLKR